MTSHTEPGTSGDFPYAMLYQILLNVYMNIFVCGYIYIQITIHALQLRTCFMWDLLGFAFLPTFSPFCFHCFLDSTRVEIHRNRTVLPRIHFSPSNAIALECLFSLAAPPLANIPHLLSCTSLWLTCKAVADWGKVTITKSGWSSNTSLWFIIN